MYPIKMYKESIVLVVSKLVEGVVEVELNSWFLIVNFRHSDVHRTQIFIPSISSLIFLKHILILVRAKCVR